MNLIIFNEFKSLIDRLNQEKEDIQKQIDDNTLQIIEARSYAKEILDREDEDFKVFSPRKIEDIYKEELEKSNVKQTDYENRNQILNNKKNEIDSLLLILENVWAEINIESDKSEESDKLEEQAADSQEQDNNNDNVIKDIVNNLNQFSSKIELSMKFIMQDPMRVKLELETVNKSMKKLASKLCDTED